MILCQFYNAVCHTSANGAEVAGVGLQVHIGKLVDQGIKGFFEEGKHLAFTPAVLIGGNDIVFRLFIQNLYHIPDDFRPLLQIGIDKADIFTAGLGQTGVNTGFLAEISGKTYHLYRTFLLGVDLAQIVHGGILAAIVNKYDLIIVAAVFKGFNGGILKSLHILRFVIAGNNER